MRMNRRQFLQSTAVAGAALTVAGCGGPPKNPGNGDGGVAAAPVGRGIPDGAYFKQLATDLSAAGYGTPQILIDLDRLDANADAIAEEIGPGRYRIVEKSLPSLELLGYISQRTRSDKFLVLHLPFLPALLKAFPTAQVLVGKVQPTAAVRQLFEGLLPAERAAAAARVRFLVDSRARLDELVALAASFSISLQVGVEVDAGLHRGGVRRPSDLPRVLAGFIANPGVLRFAGLLGYDGHIIGAPVAPGLEMAGLVAAYRAVEGVFRSCVEVIKSSDFKSLWRDDLIFNSGGSSTYPLHHGGVVNDVAAGGGMLRPASYPDLLISALSPALFITAPVIAHFDTVELPFVTRIGQSLLDGKQSFSMYGGGWAALFVWPPGVELAPLVSDPENLNLVPNESLVMAPHSPAIGPGDWIFQHPRLADALFQFENILLVRGGRLQPDHWRAYPRRY